MHNNKIRRCLAGLCVLALLQVSQVQAAACAPASVDKGSKLFAQECSVCHAVQKDVTGMMGVNLHGVAGRTSGTVPGFSYSQAMKNKAVNWKAESLQAFITQPQAFVPGTYMPYTGMAAAEDSAAVACFLTQQ
ncbi:c-type cytochrome [Pseudomonas putida]|uniref:c-type cytochrome n=1 Tax=Pseudomonas putida TaxID=303 RepID=UPI0023663FDB|nr:c-type cytochrome [Pseudomonas putida]MDD2046274.1 c-type cytochrome [Pseudomonas putida]